MRELLTGLVDVLFPPSMDDLILREASKTQLSLLYGPKNYAYTTSLSSYHHPLIKAAIKENKFHHNQKAAIILAQLLGHWHQKHGTVDTLYIPVPLSRTRERIRGHNQVLTIIQAANLVPQASTRVLRRDINTTPQSQLDRNTRLQNMKNVFSCRPDTQLAGARHVVLLDDVVTTGATLKAARDALLPHLSKTAVLNCVAIAH